VFFIKQGNTRHLLKKLVKDLISTKSHLLSKADNQVKLLRQAAAFHLKGGEPEKAAACLEQLWKLDSSDTATLARLVLLYSQVSFTLVLESVIQSI
jgi:signal recognition particle subunit SRP72